MHSFSISNSRGDDSEGEREVWGVGGESMGGSPSSRREERLESPLLAVNKVSGGMIREWETGGKFL